MYILRVSVQQFSLVHCTVHVMPRTFVTFTSEVTTAPDWTLQQTVSGGGGGGGDRFERAYFDVRIFNLHAPSNCQIALPPPTRNTREQRSEPTNKEFER